MPYKNPRDPRNVAKVKAATRARHLRRNARNREYVWELKKGPCTDCSQTFHPCVMDFDHVRGEKKDGVGYLMGSHSLARLQEEIAKCELVCSNCHRLRTYSRLKDDDRKVVERGWQRDALDHLSEYAC